KDAETLVGGSGDDLLNGRGGKDRITGGTGRDRFVLEVAASQLTATPEILDFRNGQDLLELPGLEFADLSISRGTGTLANSTLIRNRQTGEYLAVLRGVLSSSIDATDIFGAVSLPVLPPPALSVQPNPVKFSASASEATIAATAAARIQLGSQTIHIGTEQVSSINQNPVIVSFDAQNPANNWRRTDYETTGSDGRGYGLFWSSSQLYALFSVDGTQGTPDQDFRRASGGATQTWLQSYGAGGGAKVTVLARLDPTTGTMTDAVYLSARLSDGRSNSLAVDSLTTNPAGNLVVNAQSFFAPRRPDGQAMTQTTPGSSPFAYQLEITPDLKTVISTAAAGWS
ncbi:MAG: M10 family metallopeptidase C-terminal domain-containing protein, partial [Elainella sp.]